MRGLVQSVHLRSSSPSTLQLRALMPHIHRRILGCILELVQRLQIARGALALHRMQCARIPEDVAGENQVISSSRYTHKAQTFTVKEEYP